MSFLILLLITTFTLITANQNDTAVSIECLYSNVYHAYFEYEWTCTLRSIPDITQPNVVITNVTTEAPRGKNATDVKIFFATVRVVRYIPKRLEVLFPTLIGLRFENTQLSYVSKNDLKPYPNLRLFTSILNRIEFLEEDLFINNPFLEFVSFRSNQIKYIHPNVFDGVKDRLQQLWIDGTAINCGLRGAQNNINVNTQLDVLKKSQCVNLDNAPAFYIIKKQLEETCTSNTDAENDCQADIEAKEVECDAAIKTQQHEFGEILQCCLTGACSASKVQDFLAAIA